MEDASEVSIADFDSPFFPISMVYCLLVTVIVADNLSLISNIIVVCIKLD